VGYNPYGRKAITSAGHLAFEGIDNAILRMAPSQSSCGFYENFQRGAECGSIFRIRWCLPWCSEFDASLGSKPADIGRPSGSILATKLGARPRLASMNIPPFWSRRFAAESGSLQKLKPSRSAWDLYGAEWLSCRRPFPTSMVGMERFSFRRSMRWVPGGVTSI